MNGLSRILVAAACVVGTSAAIPSASAQGCTEVFVASASNPESDSPISGTDFKNLDEGIHLYPFNAPDRVADYVAHEWAAVNAYIECVV